MELSVDIIRADKMRKFFISLEILEFEKYRHAAKRAVKIMGDRPVMSEDFGARPYSQEINKEGKALYFDIMISSNRAKEESTEGYEK